MTHRGPFQPLLFCDSVRGGGVAVQLEHWNALSFAWRQKKNEWRAYGLELRDSLI